MANHVGEGELAIFKERQPAHEMLITAPPDGFNAQVLAHQQLVDVEVNRTHIDEVSDFNEGAAGTRITESFRRSGEEAGTLEDDIGTCLTRGFRLNQLGAFFDSGDFLNINGNIRAETFGKFQASGGTAYHYHLCRTAQFRAGEGYQSDGTGALHDNGIAEFDFAAHDGMHADSKRFGKHGYLGRRICLHKTGVRVGEIHVIGEAATEMGCLVRIPLKPVTAIVSAGREDNPVSLLNRLADIVVLHAITDCLNDADVFVSQKDFALETVLPIMQVGAADTSEFLPE